MSSNVVLTVFICGIYLCTAIPVELEDDKANWETVLKEMKSNSEDKNVFDQIVEINAKARGGEKAEKDENILIEGDIVMKKDEKNETTRQKRAVFNVKTAVGRDLWTKNISYAFSSYLSGQRTLIGKAINEFEQTLPCLGTWRDVTYTSRPADYIYFIRGSGCYSYVGRTGGRQSISIGYGCESHGIVVHEIGHALGLWHEQSRPDRDNYVEILWENIISRFRHNFDKQPASQINSFGVSYDYDSIMHYGPYGFSLNGRPTISPTKDGVTIGQRNGLSDKDKQQLQILYGCTTRRPTASLTGGNIRSDADCNNWKSLGYCEQRVFVDFMKKNCRKACGVVTVSCTEENINCPRWARSGLCATTSEYYTYMKESCAKSCGCI